MESSYFLTPQTHILMRQGTQITCNSLAPPMYLLGNAWYKLMPRPVETLALIIMKPLINLEIHQPWGTCHQRNIFARRSGRT